ncbi:uncharacterized protein BDFB_012443, partial [Asbolus verrucosus]
IYKLSLYNFLTKNLLAHSTLKCYDCEPDGRDTCLDPVAQNVKTTVCGDSAGSAESSLQRRISDIDLDISPRTNFGDAKTYECFSMYFESNDTSSKSGVYRGCVRKKENVLSACESLQEELKHGNVTSCQSCTEDGCNIQYVAGASSTIKCYDCGPSDEGTCLDPVAQNVKTTVCGDSTGATDSSVKRQIFDINLDAKSRNNSESGTYECFAMYFESHNVLSFSGVYRGCVLKAAKVFSSCEFLQEDLKHGNITSCQSCTEDECNFQDVGRSAATLSFSVVILMLNLTFCIFVVTF